ncbi:unnamed protein product, partial [Rotaria sp. Silwood1]
YELYDPCTVMFFYRNKHIMIDLGTGNNNKISWALEDTQEFIDIVETVYRGARKGRGLERISLESTLLNHSEIQTINNVSSLQHCFLCLDILHRYISDEFIQQIKQVAQSTTIDFQTFCCNLTLPMNLFIRHAYLLKFLTKFIGECNEKDLPIIKDQWRNLMIDRLEEELKRPYQIDVFKHK